eukprot:gnl/MRDRNA2_/MRDRNA2_230913_c0_seq1.p1 gnl/MRDRNA2_/MRDRNA2_230913_c0~~gnl/MRDRNA2_/MRDRNA2_230913_c0_seq1.p1  ORF type:complete len:287 (-),score=56.47 gnl/MRDRNA2_/MRDRNA2_230913_c0_seq1:28-777(-)
MAVQEVCKKMGVDESQVSVWYDCFSIPQASRIGAVRDAIDALMTYVNYSSAFVILAPPATHADTGDACNFETYNSRGWCRAEQAAYLLSKGTENMFCLDCAPGPNSVRAMEKNSMAASKALMVLEGGFTCCSRGHEGMQHCDREQLVDAMCWLYSSICIGKDNKHMTDLYQFMQANRDQIFPKSFVFESKEKGALVGSEQRALFEDILDVVDEMIVSKEIDALNAQGKKFSTHSAAPIKNTEEGAVSSA